MAKVALFANRYLKGAAQSCALLFLITSCSHGQKRTTPELSELQGKKVALVEIDGESTARAVVEASLVNQLIKHGSFELVSKPDVDAARQHPGQDPADWKGVGRRLGADYALRAQILEFSAETHDGYSTETVDDSQMAAEQGEKARKTERTYKVRSLDGKVRINLEFTELAHNQTRYAVAESTEQVTADARKEAIHLPPRLRFLEKLTNDAFEKFFEQYR